MRAAVALCLLAVVATARAEGDYDVDSRAWNGLGDFRALAVSSGLRVETATDLTWESLSAEKDVLFLLYPTREVDATQLTSLIRAGGRVLIADDFGKADEVIARLGLVRRPAHTVRARRWDDNANLPIAEASDKQHPLARSVPELVTNHPAVLTASGGDVFAFSGGDAVVVAGEIGTGRYVVLSDPSVLINAMLLAFDGNATFALNLLAWLAPPAGRGRIVLLTGDFRIHGETPRLAEPGTMNELLIAAGAALDDVNDYLPSEGLLRLLGAVGATGFVLLLLWMAARTRSPKQDASFARASEPGAATDWDSPATRNFAQPAAILRENLEGKVDPSLLHDLPSRADLPTAFVSRRAFVDAYDRLHKHGD